MAAPTNSDARVAALYDIHGNLPALDAVLEDVRQAGVDRVVGGGDVLPGPMPRATLDRLARIDVPTAYIMGNGDREVIAHLAGGGGQLPDSFRQLIVWSGRQLRADDVRRISQWPATLRLAIGGLGDVLFCHATPRNDVEIFTRFSYAFEQAAAAISATDYPQAREFAEKTCSRLPRKRKCSSG